MRRKAPPPSRDTYTAEYCCSMLRAADVEAYQVFVIDFVLEWPHRICFIDFENKAMHALVRSEADGFHVLGVQPGWPA